MQGAARHCTSNLSMAHCAEKEETHSGPDSPLPCVLYHHSHHCRVGVRAVFHMHPPCRGINDGTEQWKKKIDQTQHLLFFAYHFAGTTPSFRLALGSGQDTGSEIPAGACNFRTLNCLQQITLASASFVELHPGWDLSEHRRVTACRALLPPPGQRRKAGG